MHDTVFIDAVPTASAECGAAGGIVFFGTGIVDVTTKDGELSGAGKVATGLPAI
ncbi:MAG: hypothetical protein AAFP69_00540 [Planctomycetota bacterium]